MDSKEPHQEYDEYDDEDYDLSHPIPEESSFKTPTPDQALQLKPDQINPLRTVRIHEDTPQKHSTRVSAPSAPKKSSDGLREVRLTRANLFTVETNTDTHDVPHGDDQRGEVSHDQGGEVSQGDLSMNNPQTGEHDHDNDSMYTGSSGDSGHFKNKITSWEDEDLFADRNQGHDLVYGVVGINAASSLLNECTNKIFACVRITSKLTPYYNPFGTTKGLQTTIQSICNALMIHRENIVKAILAVTEEPGSGT